MILLGIDPGKSTGFVLCDSTEDRFEVLQVCTTHSLYDAGDYVSDVLDRLDRIVMESFTSLNTPFFTDANWSIRVIGVVLYLSRGAVDIVTQKPQQRLEMTDEILKRGGFGYLGDHERDALRHVLVYRSMTPPVLDLMRPVT